MKASQIVAKLDLEQHKGTKWSVKGPSNHILSSQKYGGGQDLIKKYVVQKAADRS